MAPQADYQSAAVMVAQRVATQGLAVHLKTQQNVD
jgi:hypothetical protein